MNDSIKAVLSKSVVPKLLCLFFLGLIIGTCIKGLMIFSSPNERDQLEAQPAIVQKTEINSHHALSTPLFGEYVPDNLDESSIKKSMLNLTVVGVIYAVNEQDSQVIIRSANGQDKAYRIGDALPGGVTIKRITQQGVVIGHNGTLESLTLPKNDLLFEPQAKPLIEE